MRSQAPMWPTTKGEVSVDFAVDAVLLSGFTKLTWISVRSTEHQEHRVTRIHLDPMQLRRFFNHSQNLHDGSMKAQQLLYRRRDSAWVLNERGTVLGVLSKVCKRTVQC